MPFSVLFLYDDNIGEPFKVLEFLYGPNVYQFLDLIVNDFVLLEANFLLFLFNWLENLDPPVSDVRRLLD